MVFLALISAIGGLAITGPMQDQTVAFRRTVLAVPAEQRRVPISSLPTSTINLPQREAIAVGKTFIGYRQGTTVSLVSREIPKLKSLYSRFNLCTEISQKLGDGRSQLPEAKIRFSEFSKSSKETLRQALIDQLFFHPEDSSLSAGNFMFVISGQIHFRTSAGTISVPQDIPREPAEMAKREAQYPEHRSYTVVKSDTKNPYDRSFFPELSNSTYRVVYSHEPNGVPDPALASALAEAIERVYTSEKKRLGKELKRHAFQALALYPKYFEETEQQGLSERQLAHYKDRLLQQLIGSELPSQEADRVAATAMFESREYMFHLNVKFNNGISVRDIGPASVYLWP
jgi:hypothetical protein